MNVALKRYKMTWWIATSALIVAVILFGLSFWMLKQSPGTTFWPALMAFSEAAMVGALADWFAVVALFRHPLGFPIPHTAVLVNGRERVAEAIGSFVSENFLTTSVLIPKLAERRPAYSLACWCSQRRNSSTIMAMAGDFLPTFERFLSGNGVRHFLKDNITPILQEFPLAKTASIALRNIRDTPVADNIVGKLAGEANVFVRDNRSELETQVADNLPIPSFMDLPVLSTLRDKISSRIAPLVIDKLEHYLEEVSTDPGHPLRQKIKGHMETLADRLEADPEFASTFENAKNALIASDTLDLLITHLISAIQKGLLEELLTPGTRNYRQTVIGISRMAKALKASPSIQEQVDRTLAELVTKAVERYQGQIKTEISSVVLGWDVKDMVARIEEQVGPDLQFIRLNGTLVGGTVGLVLFLITSFI